jgi:Mg2+-importing ATPase
MISPTPFWNETTDALHARLGSSADGLTSEEAAARLARYGPNDAAAVKKLPAWLRFLARFRSPLVLILLAASAVSAMTGDAPSFFIIAIIVFLSVTLDFVQERHAEKAIEALRARVALNSIVLRDGMPVTLPVRQIVPGDVVRLSAGDLAPADGLALAAHDFFVNQALLTGEPYPVEKNPGALPAPVQDPVDATNAVFAATSVISGDATVLVCRTGRDTAVGSIAQSLGTKQGPTAFEAGVQRFSTLILRITVLLVLIVLVESLALHRNWLESLLFATALAVGLTPELLPMILTITLARGALRLAKKKVVVKQLAAIHNLGAMDVLCTDKTGTLTQARIELARHVSPKGEDSERVLLLAYLNSYFETGLKSTLDEAILAHDQPSVSDYSKIDEVPFDFERRRVSVLVDKGGARTLIVKGAPEDILRLAVEIETPTGLEPMTPSLRRQLTKTFEAFGRDGFRTLGIAVKSERPDQTKAVVHDEVGLTFAGFALFLDPPKPSAGDAVRALGEAGVEIKILTGDNELVARHVCRELNIAVTGVISGDALVDMTEDALLGSVAKANLFCRVNPQQKMRILRALRRTGRTVGYIGDGINDAPALHAADVSLSVDTGADVAKAAADIILLEDDLMVVHQGILEGRRTVVNVTKYVLMASSANFGNIISMVLAGLILPFLPLLPLQVLLTNLIYDVSQMGLPVDDVDLEDVRKPVHWDIKLVERFMLTMGPVSTLFDLMTFGVLILLFRASPPEFRTGWFIESLITQILMIFSVRTRRALFASRPSRAVALLAVAGAVVAVALPLSFLGAAFHFVGMPPWYFGFLALATMGFLVVVELAKRAFYAWPSRSVLPHGRTRAPAFQRRT